MHEFLKLYACFALTFATINVLSSFVWHDAYSDVEEKLSNSPHWESQSGRNFMLGLTAVLGVALIIARSIAWPYALYDEWTRL